MAKETGSKKGSGAVAERPANDQFSKGLAAAKAGKRDDARKIFEKLTTKQPDRAEAWLWLGGTTTDLAQAEAAFEKAYAIKPDSEEATLGLRWVRARREVAAVGESIPAPVTGAHVSTPLNVADIAAAATDTAAPTTYDAAVAVPTAPETQAQTSVAMMSCPNCGHQNPASEKFCAACSQEIGAARSMQTAQAPAAKHIMPVTPSEGLPRWMVNVGVVLAVLVVIMLIWFLFLR